MSRKKKPDGNEDERDTNADGVVDERDDALPVEAAPQIGLVGMPAAEAEIADLRNMAGRLESENADLRKRLEDEAKYREEGSAHIRELQGKLDSHVAEMRSVADAKLITAKSTDSNMTPEIDPAEASAAAGSQTLAEATGGAVAAEAAPAAPKYWAVSVPGHSHPARTVEAASREAAIEKYKASLGILALPVAPDVAPTDEPPAPLE